MLQAARFDDPIAHTSAMAGLIGGAIAGALVGAALAATVATGGLAAPLLVGAILTGAAVGAWAGEFVGSLSIFSGVSGAIATGSHNVFFNRKPSARVLADTGRCSKDGPAPQQIATGSGNVFINGFPASRVDDKLTCGAFIKEGSTNISIGGGQVAYLPVESEVPEWVHAIVLGTGIAGALLLGGWAAIPGLVGALALGYVGGEVVGWVGRHYGEFLSEHLGGLPSDWEKAGTFIGQGLGGWLGAKAGGRFGESLSSKPKIDAELTPQYVDAVAKFKNSTPEEVKAFYEEGLVKGIDHRGLIENAMEKYPRLTRAEAEAIYGYTTKQWYRDFNATLEKGGSPEAEQLSSLLKSGVEKMPGSSSTTQFRGVRLNTPEDLAKFDAKFAEGNEVVSESFWSTGPELSNAYSAPRTLVIKTDSAKDISDLAFGAHFHENVGKIPYSSETIIPPGVKYKVTQVDATGNVFLEEIK